jgi:hypothetical protein
MGEDAREAGAETPVSEASAEAVEWRKVRGEVLADVLRSELLKEKMQRLVTALKALAKDERS